MRQESNTGRGGRLRRLAVGSLNDALRGMKVGESAIAPEGYSVRAVIVACSQLRGQGYLFATTTRTGQQVITRIG